MKAILPVRSTPFVLLAALVLAAPVAAQDQSFRTSGRDVVVHNLVGEIVVERTSGRVAEVEVLLRGRDAAELRVERGREGGRETVTILFPDDDIVYPGWNRFGRSQVTIRGDGWPGSMAGRTIRVTSHGRGLEAHAVVRVRLPAGSTSELHQAVGSMQIAGVQGNLTANARAARVQISDFAGELNVRSGSGGITAERLQGTVDLRTGSGRVRVSGAQGASLSAATGSGGITLSGSNLERLQLSAGSGRLELDEVRARAVSARTGSGGITAHLAAAPGSLELRTGSGGVRLTLPQGTGAELNINTGSGGISVDLPTTTLSSGRSHLRATTGDGSATIRIRTGSGAVRVRQG